MGPKRLEPNMDLLREEFVLVQAWKKTAAYIRYHNWFADTLEIDRAAANLPEFIGTIRERLQEPNTWCNDPLRIVPAPKSQKWEVQNGQWRPVKEGKKGVTAAPIRPLAHVSLTDQVVATALMLCLADTVESRQGDPRQSVEDSTSRKQIASYGNRLFCDKDESTGTLHHRWGSAKLYRRYYQDYRKFLSRPESTAQSIPSSSGWTFVLHSDLRQFYDRVRPSTLVQALNRIRNSNDDPAFFSLAASVLNWKWHPRDAEQDVRAYASRTGLEDFTRIALPQGLVASGFFANLVLLEFDEALQSAIGTEVVRGIHLADYCRYVDDLRLVATATIDAEVDPDDFGTNTANWLQRQLNEKATGLEISSDKTCVMRPGDPKQPVVRQQAKMNRIQSAVSGGFDAVAGEKILDTIAGLIRAQRKLSSGHEDGWQFSPVPDVRDETVARFGAARYRSTYRSIRPLLEDGESPVYDEETSNSVSGTRLYPTRSRSELDDDARVFALGLIQRWVEDPANVRLLRIGLDLWPDAEILDGILKLFCPYIESGQRRGAPKRIVWYCLAELLRAGATETGFVADSESFPSQINITAYRQRLLKEAVYLARLPATRIPWYLRQQALLFIAVHNPDIALNARIAVQPETRIYLEMIRFLQGAQRQSQSADIAEKRLGGAEFATLAIVARRAFVDQSRADLLTRRGLTLDRAQHIAHRDPSFFLELREKNTDVGHIDKLPVRIREDLCLSETDSDGSLPTLSTVVRNGQLDVPLRNELSLLCFADAFLKQWKLQASIADAITPGQIQIELDDGEVAAIVKQLNILTSAVTASNSLYAVPPWCKAGERWRFQLGFLLRFILSGRPDFTQPVRSASWKESELSYRPVQSHWYQRLYGMYCAQSAFGDDWLPITDWMEGFLFTLLRWPGCSESLPFKWVEQGVDAAIENIGSRINELEQLSGRASRTLILPILIKPPIDKQDERSLRACVVQTAVPTPDDFSDEKDLELTNPTIRRKHRNHLGAVLAAVERMLTVRRTHKGESGHLDWLILPELAVHPQDVDSHLVPFARTHKAIVLAGLTYEEIVPVHPLINSALWVIPEYSPSQGLQIRIRRQGKAHLSLEEQKFNHDSKNIVQGFRPCQWLIGYPWSQTNRARPLWLTSTVCYDATDLALVADLRDRSDVLAIPAFNKDVTTFDQMALALHYHMFQLVIVANSGYYGGSNAYWPTSDRFTRQIFHTHGQPQVSISFLEIDAINDFVSRRDIAIGTKWKQPPAGLNLSSPE